MELDLSGQRVLVVGASSGIGRAIAELAIGYGASVAASARRAENLAEIDGAVALPGDVRDEAVCGRIVDDAVAALGGLDALVYAVGMSPLKAMADATQDEWRAVMETNVIGAALMTAAAAPHLEERRGRAVYLSSKATRRPFPNLAMYTTSKYALDGLLHCIRAEYPNLAVTRAVVGNTEGTDFGSSWDPDEMDKALALWVESGVIGSMGMMHPNGVAQAILAVLAARVTIDDIAIIDREGDVAEW